MAILLGLSSASALAMDYRKESLPILLPSGASIVVSYKAPVARVRKRLPLVFLFGGFEGAADVLDLVTPTRPMVLASFDYPFAAPRKLRFPQSLRLAPLAKSALRLTRRAIPHVIRRTLATREDVDPERVAVIGASFGAPFAIYAAVDSPDVDAIAVVQGYGDVPGVILHRLRQVWRPRMGIWTDGLAWPLAHLGWRYLAMPAPEEHASRLRAEQRVLVLEAAQDEFIPKHSRDALWAAVQSSPARSERQIVAGGHLQPGSKAEVRNLMRRVERWLASQ